VSAQPALADELLAAAAAARRAGGAGAL